MNCAYCGTVNDPNNQYCLSCGRSLSSGPSMPPVSLQSSSRTTLWIVAGRLVGSLLFVWILRTILLDLDFVQNTTITEINLPMTTIITLAVAIVIILLLIGFISALAQLWPAAFPSTAEATTIFSALLWLILLNQIYRIATTAVPLLSLDRELITIIGIVLVAVALVLATRAFLVIYQALPQWMSTWRAYLMQPSLPTIPVDDPSRKN